MRPVIAVTCDRRQALPLSGGASPAAPRVRPSRPEVYSGEAVIQRLRDAGAAVVLLPPGDPETADVLARVDGVVITGGAFDIHPRHYGQGVSARLDRVEEGRTEMELALARACVAADRPLLGICGGMQVLAVALGGTLVQDIASARTDALDHEQLTDPATAWHAIAAAPGWAALFGPAVNSTHHQAVDHPGPLAVCARAPDGVIEAAHLPGQRFCLGVQWHPELLDGRLFSALVRACS